MSATEKIVITVTSEPFSYVVMDVRFFSDAPVRVVFFTIDGEVVPAQDEPVSSYHNLYQSLYILHLINHYHIFVFKFLPGDNDAADITDYFVDVVRIEIIIEEDGIIRDLFIKICREGNADQLFLSPNNCTGLCVNMYVM